MGEVIRLLKGALREMRHLRTLSLGNQEFELWYNKVEDILEVAFGKDSTEYDRFVRAVPVQFFTHNEAEEQKEYNRRLDGYETALKSIIRKYKMFGIAGKPPEKPPEKPPIGYRTPSRNG